MTDPLSQAISDRETHRQIMELPSAADRLFFMGIFDNTQRVKAKRYALKTAPGGKDE